MPLIDYTTEDQLKQYMRSELGSAVAEELTWTTIAASAYQTAVNGVLRAARIATVDLIDADRLELLARVEIWRQVVKEFSTAIDFSGDGLSTKNGDLFDNAKDLLAAELAAAKRKGYYRSDDDARSTRHAIRFTF